MAAYSLAIAIKLSLSDTRRLEEMATGCLLHDVGKSKVGLDILNKNGPLTVREWGVMKLHPEYGASIIERSELGLIPREIILHHHERMDGRGYPHALGSNEILEEVKVAAFADVFDALTTNRPYSLARTRYEALDFIRFNLLEQLHKDAYRAMIEIMISEGSTAKAGASSIAGI
jgi:HD-GYP domain-containing protein (c-di-GMP phosphodiesterase class II)